MAEHVDNSEHCGHVFSGEQFRDTHVSDVEAHGAPDSTEGYKHWNYPSCFRFEHEKVDYSTKNCDTLSKLKALSDAEKLKHNTTT